jgi:hypothetical protein
LTEPAADPALEVVHQAQACFALERTAFDVGLGDLEAVEILLVFVFGRAGITDATWIATESGQTQEQRHGP